MMVLVVTTGAVSRTKLQSNRHRQQTSTQLYTGRCPPVAQLTVSVEKRRLTQNLVTSAVLEGLS